MYGPMQIRQANPATKTAPAFQGIVMVVIVAALAFLLLFVVGRRHFDRSGKLRARVRALWALSGWRGNERIADSIKKGPPGARAGGGCCIRKRSSA
jgi:hypothetical protein